MLLEITPEEAQILQKGIELWESESHRNELMGSLFGAMLRPKEEPKEVYLEDCKKAQERAEKETQKRKGQVLHLKLKFLEAAGRPSEFSR